MADNEPQPHSVRRRMRRRAERVVRQHLAIENLRQLLARGAGGNGEESDSSGNVESENEAPRSGPSSEDEEGIDALDDHMPNAFEEEMSENDLEDRHDEEPNNEIGDDSSDAEMAESSDESDEAAEPPRPHPVVDPGNLTPEEKEAYLKQCLREWASSGGVLSMRKVDELLGKLAYVFVTLPKSYKTLLETIQTLDLDVANDHLMWYKGIRSNLHQLILDDYILKYGRISIDINMDGLPLHKEAGSKKFWPILGKLVGADNDPFEIAIYCGTTDPRDVELYLADFIIEIENLMQNGYEHNGMNVPFQIRNFILDAPARSLVKCCIGHSGYGACEKCSVVGEYVEGRISFANVPNDCVKRTDESYVQKADRLHHVGRSPLELIEIGMVSQFRLDTMHLLYKGVFLRLLEAIFSWDGDWTPNPAVVREISARLLSLKDNCPSDFNRKPQAIEKYYKYKATELRRFLLYDCIVAFKDKLCPELYSLVLLLHCATFILCSPHLLPTYNDKAAEFNNAFVQYSCELFGQHFVVYNIHSLTHLADECREHGTVDSFSAFPYENRLKTIKQTLRSGNLPLQQYAKRDSERKERQEVKMKTEVNVVKLSQPVRRLANQFQKISVNDVVFKPGNKDGCFMKMNGSVYLLQTIVQGDGNAVTFCGKRFNHQDNFYTYPMNSSLLGILKVWDIDDNVENVPLEEFVVLRFMVPDEDDPGSMKEILEIGRREWLSLGEDSQISCAWPPNHDDPTKLKALVTKKTVPDDTWILHECDIMSAYSNYLDAHIGLKKRLQDIDYETEKELGRGRRKKKAKQLTDSESDHETSPVQKKRALPQPPIFNKDSVGENLFKAGPSKKSRVEILSSTSRPDRLQNENTLKVIRKDRGTKADNFDAFKKIIEAKKKSKENKEAGVDAIKKKVGLNLVATSPGWTTASQDDELNTTLEVDNPDNNSFGVLNDTSTPLKRTETYISPSPHNSHLTGGKKTIQEVSKNLFGSAKATTSTASPQAERSVSKEFGSAKATKSTASPQAERSASKGVLYSGDFERKVLTLLEELNQKTEVISANQTKLNLNLLPNEKVLSKPEGMPTLPLKTREELKKMEKTLEEKDDLVANLSTYLSTYVSKDVTRERASAHKVMGALMSNSLAKDYSLRGHKGKLKFDDLYIWSAVKGAILLKIETDLKETELAVQKWLADAGWRKQSDGSECRQQKSSRTTSKSPKSSKNTKKTPQKS